MMAVGGDNFSSIANQKFFRFGLIFKRVGKDSSAGGDSGDVFVFLR
jgi:hypothetical protein